MRKTKEFKEFINRLKRFLSESGISQNALSKRAGVPQSQVCNWASGKGMRYTKNAKKVISYIENYRKEKSSEFEILPELRQTIELITHGDHKREEILTDIIKSLQPAFK